MLHIIRTGEQFGYKQQHRERKSLFRLYTKAEIDFPTKDVTSLAAIQCFMMQVFPPKNLFLLFNMVQGNELNKREGRTD